MYQECCTLYFVLWNLYFVLYQDEDLEALLAADFEIGHFIRERIVPKAVLYFTGEALDHEEVSICVFHAGTLTENLYLYYKE